MKEGSRAPLLEKSWLQRWNRLNQPRPPLLRNILFAFLFGGLISVIGQGFLSLYMAQGLTSQEAGNPAVATMIFIASVLTAVGVYDNIARVGGAGVIIPVTGFANSVTAMAVEFRREGLVKGTAAKMFALAGSVIVFGVVTAFVIGLISALI